MPRSPRKAVQRLSRKVTIGVLKGGIAALELYTDLLPGVRMTRKQSRLPKDFGAGVLGAEAATWWAISPSLLPRPWWVTALNVTFCQGVGHLAATGIRFSVRRTSHYFGWHPSRRVTQRTHEVLHTVMASITATVTATSLVRQGKQAALVKKEGMPGRRHAVAGVLAGTLGYGALLLIGEATEQSINRASRTLSRWLPPIISWPLAAAAITTVAVVASDRMLVRRWFNSVGHSAQRLNQTVLPGSSMPWEPERSGSPWSYESWHALGSQGRALVSRGPRAQDIAEVTGLAETHEPIRIYVGKVRGRSLEAEARLVLREMDRTGAFHRDTLVMMAAAGTGWLTDWSVSSIEFLTGGNCAVMAMQYSYLPSAVAYVTDHETPVTSSDILIRAILERLEQMPEERRPKFYVSGESLGAYGIADSFADADDLLNRVDGAVFSGPPRFTRLHRALTRSRDAGSPERLPIVDGGRHVRFAAVPEHIRTDFSGAEFLNDWRSPRIVFTQHASDPIVFWDWNLFIRRPAWLREPGSRGVPAPEAQQLDVFTGMRWVPFITGWQVLLDQITSLNFPGGHAHQYHEEMVYYWDGALAEQSVVEVDADSAERMGQWIRTNLIKP